MEPTRINRPIPAQPTEPLFVTWEKGAGALISQASSAINPNNQTVQKSVALTTWQNIAPGNTSIRDGFTRRDYEYVRPYERVPFKPKDIMWGCMDLYQQNGIIKNVIDMMADFASQGVDIVHASPDLNKVYRAWWKKIEAVERSERFCNLLLRCGNVLPQRRTAMVKGDLKDTVLKSVAASDLGNMDQGSDLAHVKPGEIPWDYIFINPLSIDVLGEELAPFIGPEAYVFMMNISTAIAKKANKLSNGVTVDRNLLSKIPLNILNPIKGNVKQIELDRNKVGAYYYKKDDWQVWANPMIYCIFKDITMLEKMKLADMSALDGAISHIRLWRLGSLEHKIYPTNAAVSRLATMLLNNVGGGSMDLIWGPEIDLQETSTDVYRFLGQTKYEPVLSAIYQGLGIPPTLTGGQTGGGFTNNFVSLRTLTERLKYIRDVLRKFWEREIRIFQKAMGIRTPATLIFDRMTLSDENAERALLIQLVDRNIISAEAVQRHFGEIPEIENIRMKREQEAGQEGRVPARAGPFAPNMDFEYKKIGLQSGQIAPTQTGMKLDPPQSGDQPMLDKQNEHAINLAKTNGKFKQAGKAPAKGTSGQGRPKHKTDTTKRKRKVVKPRSSAEILKVMSHVRTVQQVVNGVVNEVYLKARGKDNLRKLTDDETSCLEATKFGVLASIDNLFDGVDAETVKATIKQGVSIPVEIQALYNEVISQYKADKGGEPPFEHKRLFQADAVALYNMELQENDDESDISEHGHGDEDASGGDGWEEAE